MPVWKPTAGYIWNSFHLSHKRHLFITGTRGAGKSTLLAALAPNCPGITTHAEPGMAVFLKENGTSSQAIIGTYSPSVPGPENRMRPLPSGFSALGIPALVRCAASESAWVTIDEIGYLEAASPDYCAALEQLLDVKPVIAVVRKQDLPFLNRLLAREDAFVLDLDAPLSGTGCVIMASGLGKRFGGNKLMADFHGKPLIAHALEATRSIPNRVVVTRHQDVADYCREQGISTVLHAEPYRSDTVRLGLQALPELTCCLFCPGDQPLLRSETVNTLALTARQLPRRILRPSAGNTPGAPIYFDKAFFPELCSLPQGKGGGHLVKLHPEAVTLLPIAQPQELRDIDTPQDLRELLEQGTR